MGIAVGCRLEGRPSEGISGPETVEDLLPVRPRLRKMAKMFGGTAAEVAVENESLSEGAGEPSAAAELSVGSMSNNGSVGDRGYSFAAGRTASLKAVSSSATVWPSLAL